MLKYLSGSALLRPSLSVVLEGDPYQIGLQHGLKLKASITQVVDILHRLIKQYNPSREQRLADHVEKYLPYAEDYAPELVSEIRGIADAAGASFEEIFALNSINEVTYSPLTAGCTAFAVPATCNPNGSILIGQNQDWWLPFTRHFVVLRIKSENGQTILMTAPAGFIGYVGLNSKGIGVQANGLVSNDTRVGVPVPFVTRKILQQEKIGEAINCVISPRRASPQNYIIADANGEIYDVETTATDHEVIYIEDRAYVHANHYTSNRLREKAARWVEADSTVRANRLGKLLRQGGEKVTVEYIERALGDHTNYPRSICRHPDSRVPESKWEENWETSMSMISDVTNGKSWVAKGNPCSNIYEEFAV